MLQEAIMVLPKAMAVIGILDGPFFAAGDDSGWALAMALANGSLVNWEWCQCPEPGQAFYYSRPNGHHGWACSRCYRITQTG